MLSWGAVFWAHQLFPGGRVIVFVVCACSEHVSVLFSENSDGGLGELLLVTPKGCHIVP